MTEKPIAPEPRDPLEAELAAMQPRALSHDFAQRLADRLHAEPRPERRQRIVPSWLTPALSLALLAAVWAGGTVASLRPRWSPVEQPQAIMPLVEEPITLPPTWFAYRQALESDGGLDQLLDRHAQTLLPRTSTATPLAVDR